MVRVIGNRSNLVRNNDVQSNDLNTFLKSLQIFSLLNQTTIFPLHFKFCVPKHNHKQCCSHYKRILYGKIEYFGRKLMKYVASKHFNEVLSNKILATVN